MKKVASICVSLAFVMLVSAPVFAGAEKPAAAPAASEMSGTLAKVDGKAMMLTLKDASGANKDLYWNADTKVMGKDGKPAAADALKEGGAVKVKAMEKDGKWWITEAWLQ